VASDVNRLKEFNMKNYIKLLSFIKGHEKVFTLAVITMIISSIFEGFQLSILVPMTDRLFTNKQIILPNQNLPGFVKDIIDYLNHVDPQTMFKWLPVFVLGMLTIKNFFVYIHQYLMSDVSQRIMRDIRFKLYEKIQNLSLDYFSQKRSGELISRITNDVRAIENAVSYGVTDLCRQTLMILIYTVITFSIYPKAALIVFLIFPLIGIPMNQIGRKLRKLSKSTQEKMADINSFLFETISGIRVVKAFNTEKYEVERFRKTNFEFYKLQMKTVKRLIVLSPITEMFGGICGVIILFAIGQKVLNHELSFGGFVLFFGSIMSIISPVKKLGNVNALTQQALAANDRIYEILEAQPTVQEKTDAKDLAPIKTKIKIENVSFKYLDETDLVLDNINLDINVGELVAVVGPTGSGKSTLVNLIPRFYDPQKGNVLIDGVNVKDVTFKSLREQVGIVTQETILFNDTVRSNIAYGNFNASQAEIEEAAKKAFAHQFIQKMPRGYDTIVGDRGFRLSGGEKQRLSIARAILRNPPLLLLDEATSQLDSESEKYVQEALDQLMRGRTVVAIAHRLSTIIKANKIVVVEHGRIVGLASHDELLKTCDLYKRLYDMQFQM
jgi:subfamily B ATP-binding cassette protein MsbA